MEYLTLKEYQDIAERIITSTYPRISKLLLDDNDKFGEIVSALITADWKFDKRGNLFGYRKQRVKWAVSRILRKQENDPSFQEELTIIPDKIEQEIESKDNLGNLIFKLDNSTTLSDKEKSCMEEYFIEQSDINSIATMQNISKEAVRSNIRRAITKLGVYGENIKRFNNRNRRRRTGKASTGENGT